MAKWGRNPSGGSPAYLRAEEMPIGHPVFEMGDSDPNASAAGIPANAPMTVRRRGDFETDPASGPITAVPEPVVPAPPPAIGPSSDPRDQGYSANVGEGAVSPPTTGGEALTGDVMAGLSEEDQAAVKAGLEGWMSQFDTDTQGQILEELPNYGAATPDIQPQVITPPPAAVPEPPAATPPTITPPVATPAVATQPPTVTPAVLDDTFPPTATLMSYGPNAGVTVPETGGSVPVLPEGTNMPIGWEIPEIGPPQFGVSASLANRDDPYGVYTAMRAAGTPYDPRVATMGDYQRTLSRGYQPSLGRYMLAPQVSGTGTFAEFLADPTRTATGQEGLQQSFTNIANQLSGRDPSGLDPRYTRFFDPNRVGADALQSNLVNAALASAGGPSAWNQSLRQSLANRYQTMAMADPTQSGLGAARQFADWVSGQYGNPMAGQAMAGPTVPTAPNIGAQVTPDPSVEMAVQPAAPTDNSWQNFKNAFNDPNAQIY